MTTKKLSPFSGMQIVFASILAISLLLAINFSGRISAGRRISSERAALEHGINTLQAQATALNAQYNYVNSDAFVEAWARSEGNMVRNNEILIVPVPPAQSSTAIPAPTAQPFIAPTQEPQNWLLWWQLFFDVPPPGYESANP
jgi:cell division protein FtsB